MHILQTVSGNRAGLMLAETVPLRSPAETGHELGAAPRKSTVFLVDDDPGLRHSAGRLLQAAGFAVEGFASAELLLADCGAVCDPATSGCLVLDLHLPGLDGVALLAALRERGSMLPALLITARAADAFATKAAAVFNAVLEKPFPPGGLVRSVREVMAIGRD